MPRAVARRVEGTYARSPGQLSKPLVTYWFFEAEAGVAAAPRSTQERLARRYVQDRGSLACGSATYRPRGAASHDTVTAAPRS